MSDKMNIPQHIAIIMDGNGRWARQRGKERSEGHIAGMNSLRETVRNAAEAGVKYLTVYAFSTENWGRPQAEVDALMELICKGVEMESEELAKVGIRVKTIGDRSRFSDKVKASLEKIEQMTQAGENMTFVLALNYSSRSEMTTAVQNIAKRVAAGEIKECDWSSDVCSSDLYAFSTENWGRPQAEVDALMELICKGVEMERSEERRVGKECRSRWSPYH